MCAYCGLMEPFAHLPHHGAAHLVWHAAHGAPGVVVHGQITKGALALAVALYVGTAHGLAATALVKHATHAYGAAEVVERAVEDEPVGWALTATIAPQHTRRATIIFLIIFIDMCF